MDALVAFETSERPAGVQVVLQGKRGRVAVTLDQDDLLTLIDGLIEARNDRWPDLVPLHRVTIETILIDKAG